MTITGEHIIGLSTVTSAEKFQSTNPITNQKNNPEICESNIPLIDKAVKLANDAFTIYKDTTRQQRADFLRSIARELQANSANIIATAINETGLPEVRITGELGRTMGQFNAFADYITTGNHLNPRIDTAMPQRQPLPKPDLRSINRPLGVVGVFGASNFPLAFSTAGGDTAAALAAGCSVVVRGHNAHPLTSEWVARSIMTAVKQSDMPDGVFSLVQGNNYEVSYALVEHPLVKAVGFTGSTYVGRILFDKATSRPEPIPFYGELGSINPVVLCPHILAQKPQELATGFIASLTMGAGQFCTNPGLIIALESEALDKFIEQAKKVGSESAEQVMLTPKIATAYFNSIAEMTQKTNTPPIYQDKTSTTNSCAFNLFSVTGSDFIANDDYQSEIFGPSSLIVKCSAEDELQTVLNKLHGQLTGTIWMDDTDNDFASKIINSLSQKVGRVLFNGFPTGVEVTHAMVHGGPYPASTDSRTTSVGTMAIYRFMRPISYQQTPQNLLPVELQDPNPDKIMRLVNGVQTTDAI